MAVQTPRGIPAPQGTDPDAVPAYLQMFASFLDPGPLVPYDPATAAAQGSRIVFLVEGDSDPITLGTEPLLGTVFFDRSRARLWVPFTQLVNGVDTLSWYRIGADADAEIATLAAALIGVIRTGTDTDLQVRVGSVALALTSATPGQPTQAWLATVTFAEPFLTKPKSVNVTNTSADIQPNVTLGVQNVTNTGFTVQISRSDTPFFLNDEVTVDYQAYGN